MTEQYIQLSNGREVNPRFLEDGLPDYQLFRDALLIAADIIEICENKEEMLERISRVIFAFDERQHIERTSILSDRLGVGWSTPRRSNNPQPESPVRSKIR
jgi:hypothetical protein